MTARDIMTKRIDTGSAALLPSVAEEATLFDVLPRLLDSPTRSLAVTRDGITVGAIDRDSMLEGLGAAIQPRDDASVLVVECAPADYSASLLAHAVEDVDVHLCDLNTTVSDRGRLRVTMRVLNRDPQAAIRSLERYGFNVTEAYSAPGVSQTAFDERLAMLQTYLNV